MLAKDAGKRDRREIGFPTLQLEKGSVSHMHPLLRPPYSYYVPHTLRWPRGYGDCISLTFLGPVAELTRSKVQDGKNSTQTAEGYTTVKSTPRNRLQFFCLY